MECIGNLHIGFDVNSKPTMSKKQALNSVEGFKVPCRKCLPCRLNSAREKAIRCLHEAMDRPGIFLTLTYDDENLTSPRLQYSDYQKFMKRLRFRVPDVKFSYMVTGEYGEKTKRPHWHAILYGLWPEDAKKEPGADDAHPTFTSKLISECWPQGRHNFGEITLDSASYVARYAAKKLVHGKDQEHDFHPIHRTSCRPALGTRFIEKHWRQVFTHGFVRLPNGQQMKIPRYYVDWLKKHKPLHYQHYEKTTLLRVIAQASAKSEKEFQRWLTEREKRKAGETLPTRPNKVKEIILQSRFKRLQENAKI